VAELYRGPPRRPEFSPRHLRGSGGSIAFDVQVLREVTTRMERRLKAKDET
jgi:hypothetical protein